MLQLPFQKRGVKEMHCLKKQASSLSSQCIALKGIIHREKGQKRTNDILKCTEFILWVIRSIPFFILIVFSNIFCLVAQMVKNLPAMQETQIQSLGWEDSPGEGDGNTRVFLPGEFHGQGSLMNYNPWGSQRIQHD